MKGEIKNNSDWKIAAEYTHQPANIATVNKHEKL